MCASPMAVVSCVRALTDGVVTEALELGVCVVRSGRSGRFEMLMGVVGKAG